MGGKCFSLYWYGTSGDQTLSSQNKTVAESSINNIELHLFEVFVPQRYVYMGTVEPADNPYQEGQLDDEGAKRLVWIFPLKLKVNQQKIIIPDSLVKKKQVQREKRVKKLSDIEIINRAKAENNKSGKRKTISSTYERDPFVSEFAKRWAKGICQLCDQPAPFINKKGEPHLHTHHIEWLSRKGEDSIYNTIALCPNCHDKMHLVDSEIDETKLGK